MGKTEKPQEPENAPVHLLPDFLTIDEQEKFRAGLPVLQESLLVLGYNIVEKSDLDVLMAQNLAMKTEIGQLIGLFKNFEGLLSGKGGPLALVSLIPKLLNSPEIRQQIEQIYPIIEKYSK